MVNRTGELTWIFWAGQPKGDKKRLGWGGQDCFQQQWQLMAALPVSDTTAGGSGNFQKGSISHRLKLEFCKPV